MKEELEELGFALVERNNNFRQYELHIDEDRFIWICLDGEVFIEDFDCEAVWLFPYNYQKIKQLIELLS